MVLIHGTIIPRAGEKMEDGYLRIENGVFSEIGTMPCPYPEDEVIDLHGKMIYPGFIDAHTHLGMWEDGLAFEGDDGNEETDPVMPHLRAVDAINPKDHCFQEALEAGITTVVTGPGSANPIGGQLAAVKTAGVCIDRMVVKAPVAMKMALGENPKSVYHEKNQAPSTRMATAALIREQLYKAKRYLEEKERAACDEDVDEPEFDIKCEALIPVLKRELAVHFHAHRADDIFTAIRIGKEFHLDYVIVHGTEGFEIADVLKEENVRVLAGPILCDRSKPELKQLTPAAPGILQKRGIPIALVTDHPVIPVQYLPLCAALAVREGLDETQALHAITQGAAELCGISDRVGSIERGKDADFSIFAQDPISLWAKPDMVFVAGKKVFERRADLS